MTWPYWLRRPPATGCIRCQRPPDDDGGFTFIDGHNTICNDCAALQAAAEAGDEQHHRLTYTSELDTKDRN